MDESDKLSMADQAWMGWQTLPAHVKMDIRTTLEPLVGMPPERWPARIQRWRPAEDLYLLPVWVGGEELFVFLRPQGQRIHIQSMYLRELIDRLNGHQVAEAT